ncbi:MAG: glycosyltransferase family 2 protein [bacterium]|nr:glycosyltransferase family 2 protein [bacterium]
MHELFAGGNGKSAEVAVLVSLHNYAGYIGEALDSVAAQTLKAMELIVCDDCSTDEGPDITIRWMKAHAGRFSRLLLVRNAANRGRAATRDTSLALAEAPYTFILDADNFIFPRCLERLRVLLEEASEEVTFAYSQSLVFDDVNRSSCRLENLPDWDPLCIWSGNYIAMALHRTSALRSIGGYTVEPPFDHGGWEDYKLLIHYALRGWRGVKVSQPLMAYRIHEGSVGHIFRGEKNAAFYQALWDKFPELYGSN